MKSYLLRVRSFSPDVKLILLYCLLAGIGYGVIELIFNFYLLELGYKEDFIGQWRAISTLAVAGSSFFLGNAINRFGTWLTMVAGFILLSVSCIGMSLATTTWQLLPLAIGYGASLSYLTNPVLPFIMDHERGDQRQHASAVSLSVFSLSVMIGSLLGGVTPDFFARIVPSIGVGSAGAYRAAMLAGTFIAILALIPLFRMKEARSAKPQRRSRASLKDESPAERKQTRMDIAQFALMGGLMSIGVGMLWPFYNVFLKSLGSSDDQIGYIFAIAGLVGAIAGLIAPVVVARKGALNSTFFLRLSVVPLFVLLIFVPTAGLAVIAFYWRAATASIAWPIEVTFISELLPPRARAGIFGVRSSVWNLGYAAATYAGGFMIVRYGYNPALIVFAVFSVLSAVVYYMYFARDSRVLAGEVTTAWSPVRRARLLAQAAQLEADVGESEATATV